MEVSQIKRDLASVSQNLKILKASSESTNLPPMVLKAHQVQVEHNIQVKNVLIHELRTELTRLFKDEMPANLTEIINKGEQKIDKRNQIIHIADVHGWQVANEYEGNVMGLNDTDSKRLEDAEKRVQKKNEKRAKEAYNKNKEGESRRKATVTKDEKGRRSSSREHRYLINPQKDQK